MIYYTEIVPFELAKKLKEAGFPQDECIVADGYAKDGKLTSYYWQDYAAPMYCEVFDWLIREGLCLEMERNIKGWLCYIYSVEEKKGEWACFDSLSFHEAANAAIEKACEILKGNG